MGVIEGLEVRCRSVRQLYSNHRQRFDLSVNGIRKRPLPGCWSLQIVKYAFFARHPFIRSKRTTDMNLQDRMGAFQIDVLQVAPLPHPAFSGGGVREGRGYAVHNTLNCNQTAFRSEPL